LSLASLAYQLKRASQTQSASIVSLILTVCWQNFLPTNTFLLRPAKKSSLRSSLPDDSDQQQESKSRGTAQLKFQTVERDGDRITRVAISALPHGRSATELVRHFALGKRDPSMLRAGSTTNMESIVSASKPNYLLVDRMEAAEVLFNLPEGSGLRAEFSGKNVEINRGEKATTVIVTSGKIELIDAGGVIRAWASPDGGAEQLGTTRGK
jgi:hypothetical protein